MLRPRRVASSLGSITPTLTRAITGQNTLVGAHLPGPGNSFWPG